MSIKAPNLFFIFNNLKCNPFILGDHPLPGFELLAWDSWTIGTLWDRGTDAGFTKIGHIEVHGQIWKVENFSEISTLEEFLGVYKGATEKTTIEVVLPINELEKEKLAVTTYSLAKIDPSYKIVNDGRWRF